MGYDREKVRRDLTVVILDELSRLGVSPTDGVGAIMRAPEIWKALCASGKMPREMSFQGMMNGMMKAGIF